MTDRIRAAKLKERKEGQGKVRNQRREISRYKKLGMSPRQVARAQSAEGVMRVSGEEGRD